MIGLADPAEVSSSRRTLTFQEASAGGLLAVLFPYIQKVILYVFDFNVTEYVTGLFDADSILGKMFDGNSAPAPGWASSRLEIPSADSSYWDVLEFVHEKQMKNPKHLSLSTDTRQAPSGKYETFHDFIPSVGTHKFRFQGKKFQIERKQDEKLAEPYSAKRLENLVLTASGSNTSIFNDMLVQASGTTAAEANANAPLSSVVLADGVSETILADIQDFIDSANWYTEFGVPYRRGYLLYGPPGTGKTSFISAVAGNFNLNVCILSLSDKSLTDEILNRMMVEAPEDSLILLEDIDAAFGNRDDNIASGSKLGEESKTSSVTSSTAFEGMNRLTFSGLLNALDGVASSEGRILFMTTNYVDRLDPALIRPGRVDKRQYIGYADESQVERMFRRFRRNAEDDEVKRFVREVFDRPERPDISLAQLQGLFLRYKNNPDAIFSGLSMLYDEK
ncbi:Mitochondrial chaperone BCS1 [Hypsibius exemplaris]|uniref:Mitochondrial chaperone BCS1 n=1 Tax=Hypsibius exemplaris TaxID=2072580 RepID=A0A1W0X956_HYPEX|nr:Mitochondrial chaperone BCS1 [Hypsibius exemplaris]